MQENLVFVISLKSDEARRDELRRRFKSYDKFKLIDAVDGRTMSAREYFGYVLASFRAYDKLLSPAEVGCALSHVRAYEAFLASEAKFALVLEDDVIGDDTDVRAAFELAEQMPANSLLICGCQDGLAGRFSAFGKRVKFDKKESNLRSDTDKKNDPNLDKNASNLSEFDAHKQNANSLQKHELWQVSRHSYGTIYRAAAYVIDKQSATALLKTHKDALCVADFWKILLLKNGIGMYFSDIFSHPLDLKNSNIQSERIQKGASKISLKSRFESLKFIIATRFEAFFCGFERIFKDKN